MKYRIKSIFLNKKLNYCFTQSIADNSVSDITQTRACAHTHREGERDCVCVYRESVCVCPNSTYLSTKIF